MSIFPLIKIEFNERFRITFRYVENIQNQEITSLDIKRLHLTRQCILYAIKIMWNHSTL